MDNGEATLRNDLLMAGITGIIGSAESRCDGLPFERSEWNLADYVYWGEIDDKVVMYGVWFRVNPEMNPPVETCITKATRDSK